MQITMRRLFGLMSPNNIGDANNTNNTIFNNTHPFFTICRLLFTPIIRWLNLPASLTQFVLGFWSVTSTLVGTYGIFPVLRVLYGLRLIIRSEQPLDNLLTYGPNIARVMIAYVRPFWGNIITTRSGIITYLSLVFYSTIFFILRPVLFFLVKWSLRLIISSLGILWTKFFRGFDFLLNYATTVRNLFKSIGLELPIPTPKSLFDFKFKNIAKLFVVLFTFGALLIGLDLNYPDLLNHLPCKDMVLGLIYWGFTPLAIVSRKTSKLLEMVFPGFAIKPKYSWVEPEYRPYKWDYWRIKMYLYENKESLSSDKQFLENFLNKLHEELGY